MSDSKEPIIKQKRKDVVQLEMNYLGLIVLHMCLFLWLYLGFESGNEWLGGVAEGEEVTISVGIVLIVIVLVWQSYRVFSKSLVRIKQIEDIDEKYKEYVKSAFKRYLLVAFAAFILILSLYIYKDPFFAAIYVLLLVYATTIRPDNNKILFEIGLKKRVKKVKEEKPLKRRY
ncbi:hypothetical protein [Peijinzhouia sedimentorum]